MSVRKQPESTGGELRNSADDWFRQFLKHLEFNLAESGQSIRSDSVSEYRLSAMRAVTLTLRDSGAGDDEIVALFGRIAVEDKSLFTGRVWNAELNKRRFDLIDRDIQGTLSYAEQIELAGLTHLMREHVDSEINAPFEGAIKLHQYLAEVEPDSTELEQ